MSVSVLDTWWVMATRNCFVEVCSNNPVQFGPSCHYFSQTRLPRVIWCRSTYFRRYAQGAVRHPRNLLIGPLASRCQAAFSSDLFFFSSHCAAVRFCFSLLPSRNRDGSDLLQWYTFLSIQAFDFLPSACKRALYSKSPISYDFITHIATCP